MTNTTTRTRKAAATKKAAPVKKAPAKKVAAAPVDKPKKEQTFEERDWTYLDDKPPSEQHELLAREINRRTNLEEPILPEQVQAVLAMFPHFQRSATNKNRSQYRPLAGEIVHQRSVHMTLAHKEAREIMDGLAQEANAKATKKTVAKKATTPAKKTTASKPATKKLSITGETIIAGAKAAAKKAPTTRKARVTKKTASAPAAAAAAF